MQPQIDDGRFPIKRTVGEAVFATADVFADGHDRLAGVLKYRHEGGDWQEVPLAPLGDDAWGAMFTVTELGEYQYTFEAWIDWFGSWLAGLVAWADAGEDVAGDLLKGADLVEKAALVRLKPDTDVRWHRRRASAGDRRAAPERPRPVGPCGCRPGPRAQAPHGRAC